MSDQKAADIQRRVTFLSIILGLMLGLGLVAIGVAIYTQSPFVLISVLPLAVGAIPVSRAIRKSRDTQQA